MNLDMLKQIKEAENKADEIVMAAGVQAREHIARSHHEADEIMREMSQSAQKEIEKMFQNAESEASAQKQAILNEAKKQTDTMDALTRPKIEKAAEFIIERIVG